MGGWASDPHPGFPVWGNDILGLTISLRSQITNPESSRVISIQRGCLGDPGSWVWVSVEIALASGCNCLQCRHQRLINILWRLKIIQFGALFKEKKWENYDRQTRCKKALEKAGASEEPQNLSFMNFRIRPLCVIHNKGPVLISWRNGWISL